MIFKWYSWYLLCSKFLTESENRNFFSCSTILDKNVVTFYQITTFLGYQIYSFPPAPPSSMLSMLVCCQNKVGWIANPMKQHWTGGRGEWGNEYSLPAGKSLHMQKKCDIHLSQLVLSKVVAFIQSLMFWSLLSWSDPLQPQASSWWT